jgi:hypothetical protein
MKRSHSMLLLVGMITILGASPDSQQPAPREAFKAVHLVNLTADDVTMFLSAIADVNAVLVDAGHSEARYHLYKVAGKQSGDYTYLWESSWPSGAVYDDVHGNPMFLSAIKKHPVIERLMTNEVYNRYVEVTSAKP